MPGAVLQCTQELVNGICPEGASQWVQQESFYDLLWKLPPGTVFHDVLQAGIHALLAPAVVLVFVAFASRKVVDQI